MTYAVSFFKVERLQLNALGYVIDIIQQLVFNQMIGYHLVSLVRRGLGSPPSMGGGRGPFWLTPPAPSLFWPLSGQRPPENGGFFCCMRGLCRENLEKLSRKIWVNRGKGLEASGGLGE